MLIIYKALTDSNGTASQYSHLLPPALASRIAQYKKNQDQQSRIIAKLVLHRLLLDFQLPFSLLDLQYLPSNKPYFASPSFDFSTAHCSGMVLCGGLLDTMSIATDQPPARPVQLGIDVEFIDRNLDLNLYRDYLHPSEWAFILYSPDIPKAFYSIWTRKEAFAKATGIGIDLVFRQHDMSSDIIEYQNTTYYVQDLIIDGCYMAAVVSNKQLIINILDFSL